MRSAPELVLGSSPCWIAVRFRPDHRTLARSGDQGRAGGVHATSSKSRATIPGPPTRIPRGSRDAGEVIIEMESTFSISTSELGTPSLLAMLHPGCSATTPDAPRRLRAGPATTARLPGTTPRVPATVPMVRKPTRECGAPALSPFSSPPPQPQSSTDSFRRYSFDSGWSSPSAVIASSRAFFVSPPSNPRSRFAASKSSGSASSIFRAATRARP